MYIATEVVSTLVHLQMAYIERKGKREREREREKEGGRESEGGRGRESEHNLNVQYLLLPSDYKMTNVHSF